MDRIVVQERSPRSQQYWVLGTRYLVLASVTLALLLAADSLFAQPPSTAEPPPANSAAESPAGAYVDSTRPSLIVCVTIFALAVFLGVELIGKVPATLHTPLMSGSNAISGITVVGAIIAAGAAGYVGPAIGFVAIVLAMINVVGGFLVTQRMLRMFKRK
jgi:NAD(P) transhydrogenase subunit alpha